MYWYNKGVDSAGGGIPDIAIVSDGVEDVDEALAPCTE